MENNINVEQYSSHIFLFPFKWEYKEKGRNNAMCFHEKISIERIEEQLLEKKMWKKIERFDENIDKDSSEYRGFVSEHVRSKIDNVDNKKNFYINRVIDDNDEILKLKKIKEEVLEEEQKIELAKEAYEINKEHIEKELQRLCEKKIYEKNYNEYVYYFDNVRDAIYTRKDSKENIVHNYILKHANGKYNIYLKNREKPYELDIDEIKLKIFNTGIGILSFHLDNRKYENQEDILKINEYGRRIYPQFLPLSSAKDIFLADKLELSIKIHGNNPVDKFEEYVYGDNESDCLNNNRISPIIMKLLGDNFTFNDKKTYGKHSILITPIIDDRMYTMCWYGNNSFSSHLKYFDEGKKEYEYLNSDLWHKFVFVDGNDVTCQNVIMKKELLSKHTYARWANKGTLYGISMYSFMMVTDASVFSKILRTHFKTMYYEMVCLTLAQRATVLRFSNEASKVSSLDKDDKLLEEKVRSLYKHYIEFINKLYLRQVTAQTQGIELYDILFREMNIEREVKGLDEEIDELHNFVSFMSEKRKNELEKKTNELLNVLTVIGGLFLIPSFITGFYGMNVNDGKISDWLANNQAWIWINEHMILPSIGISVLIFLSANMKKNKRTSKVLKIMSITLFILVMVWSILAFLTAEVNVFDALKGVIQCLN